MPPRIGPTLALGAAVGLLAFALFGVGLAEESHFVDESAYLSQTYFADLYLAGDRDNPLWLDRPAFDLPPLPKYFFGLALRAVETRRPGPAAAEAWYRDTSKRFVSPEAQAAARWASVAVGALGCVAVFAIGTTAGGRRVGVLAALLLMINPLYRTHARRAMSDVHAEAFLLLALAAGLWAWRELLAGRSGPTRWLAAGTSGLFAGLSILSKLTGGLAMIVLAAWVVLAATLAGIPPMRKAKVLLAAVVAAALAFGMFMAGNPFLTARPAGPLVGGRAEVAKRGLADRLKLLVEYRKASSGSQQVGFPHNATVTPLEKLEAVAVQGFGRFGPLGPRKDDSTRRFDWDQDRGALLWWPCVALGAVWAWRAGRRQRAEGGPPTAWAVLTQAGVAAAVITALLPMAWDRYYLPLQAGSALLAAGGLVAAFDRLASAARPSSTSNIAGA